MMRLTALATLLAGIVGCSTADGIDTPPTLEVTSPERGTTSDGQTVTVTGRATDDGKPVRVSVNGTDVTPAADGTFTATVAVESGISVIETHAIDQGGNDVRDVRAVLAGTLAPSDGSLASPIGARVGVPGLRSIGNALGTTAENIDFTAAVKAMNPVYQNTGCLGATVNVTSVTLSNIDVALVPATGVLSTGVAIDNVVVKAAVNYKAACIGGSSNITVRVAKARINGNLGVAVTSGNLTTSLAGATVALDGFQLDASGVPGVVEDLLQSKVRDAVANALTKVIRDRVPPMATTALNGLVSKPLNAEVLGHATNVSIAPKQVVLGADGLFISVDSKLAVTGGEGGMFVTRTAPIDAAAMESSTGLSVALADDLVNQLFSGLWAAGALDQSVSIDSVGVLGALLDDDARSLGIELMLPPTVTTRGTDLTLSIGDLIVSVRDEAGTEIQRLALSISTTLAAEPTQTGKIMLTVGAPEVKAQVLAQTDVVDRLLTDEQVEGIVTGVWGVVGGQADQALSTLPMPSVAGVTLGAPTIEGRDGFVLASMTLE